MLIRVTCKACGVEGLAYIAPETGYDYDRGEALQGFPDLDSFMNAGGFTRSGTTKQMCEDCDPTSMQNLNPLVRERIEGFYINVVYPLADDLGGDLAAAYDIVFPVLKTVVEGEI